jgi:hypothetical protein
MIRSCLDLPDFPYESVEEPVGCIDESAYKDGSIGLQILEDYARNRMEVHTHLRFARRLPRPKKDDGALTGEPCHMTELCARLQAATGVKRLEGRYRGRGGKVRRGDNRKLGLDVVRGQHGLAVLVEIVEGLDGWKHPPIPTGFVRLEWRDCPQILQSHSGKLIPAHGPYGGVEISRRGSADRKLKGGVESFPGCEADTNQRGRYVVEGRAVVVEGVPEFKAPLGRDALDALDIDERAVALEVIFEPDPDGGVIVVVGPPEDAVQQFLSVELRPLPLRLGTGQVRLSTHA